MAQLLKRGVHFSRHITFIKLLKNVIFVQCYICHTSGAAFAISLDVTTFSILVNEGFFASIKFNAPIISHIVSLKLSVLLPMSFFHLILLDNIVD